MDRAEYERLMMLAVCGINWAEHQGDTEGANRSRKFLNELNAGNRQWPLLKLREPKPPKTKVAL
jgi:hypothetical protein